MPSRQSSPYGLPGLSADTFGLHLNFQPFSTRMIIVVPDWSWALATHLAACFTLLESFQANLSHGDAPCLAFVLIELGSVVGQF